MAHKKVTKEGTMRSTMFVTVSLIVHALCFTALAVNHFKQLPEGNAGTEVEVTMGEGVQVADASGTQEVPEVKPLPVKEEPKKEVTLPKKAPVAKKVVKNSPAKTLPKKETVAETELPPNMNPVIEDSQAVTVAPEEQSDEKVELIPVKDLPPAGVQAAASDEAEDKSTEAISKDVSETKDPAPVSTEGDGKGAALNKGGDTKSEAVSYLELKQYSGNQPPVYPMSARKEQRQGQVDLLYRVTKDGRIAEVQVAKSSGHPDLDEAAVKSIAKYKYVPGQEGWARHPVIFAIKGAVTTLPSRARHSNASAE